MVLASSITSMADDTVLTATRIFTTIPETDLPMLPFRPRLDLIDYYNAGSNKEMENIFVGECRIDTLTDNYMKVAVSAGSTLEIRILPMGKKYVAAESYTYGDADMAADTQLTFLNEEAQPLKLSKFFKEPELKEFFDVPKGSDVTLKEILAMIPYPTIEYSFSADNTDMVARLTIEKYMNTEDFEFIKKYMVPEIRYKWMSKGTYTKSK